jgi:hypothetical protein
MFSEIVKFSFAFMLMMCSKGRKNFPNHQDLELDLNRTRHGCSGLGRHVLFGWMENADYWDFIFDSPEWILDLDLKP